MQQLIMEADEIIFFFPIWWGWFPAILKNFFDVNFSLGFAFEKQWDTSIPMLNWKKISIFCTCSSPSYRYEYAFISYINKHFIECCWMELNNFFIFWNRELKLKKNILKNILAIYN
jgi:NAD(P)H dehydrogenase (quinone)